MQFLAATYDFISGPNTFFSTVFSKNLALYFSFSVKEQVSAPTSTQLHLYPFLIVIYNDTAIRRCIAYAVTKCHYCDKNMHPLFRAIEGSINEWIQTNVRFARHKLQRWSQLVTKPGEMIPAAARYEAQIRGSSLAGTAGSNAAGGVYIFLLGKFVLYRWRPLRWADPSFRGS